MTHEETQREYAQDLADNVLPAPGDRFAKFDARRIDRSPDSIDTATVRKLRYDPDARDVTVDFRYCDNPGAFVGNDSLSLAEFRERYPVKLEDE